ncbi:hypothetical protein [Planctomicrobium piriforme]|uniref:Uncharacterized protein n=1 Tax=Planctomicrobium piriforme TaxID=1576369 RepID=A0A1I3HE14_9PLAN|nr:hypothetical protein [Planctomicrobium piriforme]SFI33892.1 hypothetical protein SAMN05421753_10821 [Planctomicrobium piriforme]
MRPRLRLFTGDDRDPVLPPTMTITFGELMSILDEASRRQRTWLKDFSEDGVQIPEDLYEVLTEYHSQVRPGA